MADYEERRNLNADREENPPQLFSKTLILVFALLFSTIFAAALLMYNLKILGKSKASWWVLSFAIGWLMLTAIVIQGFNLDPSMTLIANVIGAAVLNEFFWNKFIGRDTEYKRKSWIKPLGISILIALMFLLLVMTSV